MENNYPADFVDTHIQKRLNVLIDRSRNPIDLNEGLPDRNIARFTFPCVKGLSQSVARVLKQFNVSCNFRNVNDLSHLYSSLKDKTPLSHVSNVVYKIPCGGCNASYIGQTERWIKTRVYEHEQNIKRKSDSHTALTKHKMDKDRNFKYED